MSLKINTKRLGEVYVNVTRGITRSSVDAYADSGYCWDSDADLTDKELDYINDNYSGEIQLYAVENLNCYWE